MQVTAMFIYLLKIFIVSYHSRHRCSQGTLVAIARRSQRLAEHQKLNRIEERELNNIFVGTRCVFWAVMCPKCICKECRLLPVDPYFHNKLTTINTITV